MRLSELKTGESATIVKVMGHGGFRRRIMEMGFVRGQRVEVILNAPLKDPIEYKIMGYDISLRRSEADMVVVLTDDEAGEYLARRERHRHHRHAHSGECGCPAAETAPAEIRTEEFGATESDEACCASIDEVVARHSRTIAVALVGNPNSGKTSLFNAISGGHEHVGNYSGVTVGAKIGHRTYRGYRFEVTDLPGTYALSAYTPEERYVRHHLATKTPDVVINSVVASNLERNLYLTTELIDINPRMVVALNMFDELQDSGAKLDYDSLGRMLGVPMVPVEARNNRGIEALLDTVIDVFENRDERVRHIHINMGPVIDEGLRKLNGDMSAFRDELPKNFPPRYYAMKMLEGDRQAEESLRGCERYGVWAEIRDREARRIAGELGEDVETAFANQKYGFIQGALKETFTPGRRDGNHRENGRSDAGKGIPDRGRGGGGLALAAAARERRLHDGLGAGVPHLHPALHALHRHGGRHRRRSRVEMGCGVGGLQHDAGLVRGVDRISDRTDILNDGLAGLHRRSHRAGGCGHCREAAVVFRARTAAGRMRVVRVGAMPAQEAHRQELICRTRAAPGRFSK